MSKQSLREQFCKEGNDFNLYVCETDSPALIDKAMAVTGAINDALRRAVASIKEIRKPYPWKLLGLGETDSDEAITENFHALLRAEGE